jgi:dihydrofolate synthase / folylpolyglutamate synthase
MNYDEVIEYLYSQLPMFHRIGPAAYKPGLDNTLALLHLVGNPQNHLHTVHVAGTNGKGSTSHMIASVLQEAGYKVGLYTSPHLKDFRERIKINGQMISKEAVTEFVELYKDNWAKIQPSFFEITVALCFWYFEKEKTDISVIEVGLGGRLDSTNVIVPEVSVITNIGMDHMNLLGDTLEKIAAEKAGIIKTNVPVVLGKMRPEVRHIMQEFADKHKTSISDFAKIDMSIVPLCELKGNYQEENRATAFAALEILRKEKNWHIADIHIQNGFSRIFANTGLMGRWQILGQEPLIVADVAHNEDGILSILNQIATISFKQLHFVLGLVGDKDVDRVLRLLPQHAVYYFCKANIPRGLDAAELKERAGHFHLKGEYYSSVTEALNSAKENAASGDMVFVGGSVFTVAEVV